MVKTKRLSRVVMRGDLEDFKTHKIKSNVSGPTFNLLKEPPEGDPKLDGTNLLTGRERPGSYIILIS